MTSVMTQYKRPLLARVLGDSQELIDSAQSACRNRVIFTYVEPIRVHYFILELYEIASW